MNTLLPRSDQHPNDPRRARFHFRAGRLAIDFANTGGIQDGVAVQDMHTPADLARWFSESSLGLADLEVGNQDLDAAYHLRDAVWRAAMRYMERQTPDASDIDVINRFASTPSLAPQIDSNRDGVVWAAPATVASALATIARDAVDLFTSTGRERIRVCASPTCMLLFVDTSRPGTRRWCAMEHCGNIAKTRSYRHREPERSA